MVGGGNERSDTTEGVSDQSSILSPPYDGLAPSNSGVSAPSSPANDASSSHSRRNTESASGSPRPTTNPVIKPNNPTPPAVAPRSRQHRSHKSKRNSGNFVIYLSF